MLENQMSGYKRTFCHGVTVMDLTVLKNIFHCSFLRSQSENKEKYIFFFQRLINIYMKNNPSPKKTEVYLLPIKHLAFFPGKSHICALRLLCVQWKRTYFQPTNIFWNELRIDFKYVIWATLTKTKQQKNKVYQTFQVKGSCILTL